MTRTPALGRRTCAGAALAIVLGALLALGLTAPGTLTAAAGTSGRSEHVLPFSFD